MKEQKCCSTQGYYRRAGVGKAFLDLCGGVARTEEPLQSPETSMLQKSVYWLCILHYALNNTMHIVLPVHLLSRGRTSHGWMQG